jgi:hypothetical protein
MCYTYSIMRRLALTTLVIGIWIAGTQGQPEQRVGQGKSATDTNKATVSKQNQQSSESEAIYGLIKEMQIEKEQKAQERQAQENRANQDIGIQAKLVKYTRALVWVGGLQALVLLLTVAVLRLQVRTARETERAWMIGSPNMEKLGSPPDGRANLLYVCNLKNTGRTPARILQSGLAFRKAKSVDDIPRTPSYREDEIFSFEKVLIVPQDSFASTTMCEVTTEEILAVKGSERRFVLYAYGFVKYLDVFGKLRETCFCHYYYMPESYEPPIEGFRLCVEAPAAYNKAT